jgi:hypothetical protein
MSGNPKPDMDSLRGMLGLGAPETSEPTPFARSVTRALTQAVTELKANGTIEVEDANVEALATQVAQVVLESTSLKKLPLRIVKTLIHSDLVEEVFGTDEEISTALHPFLDGI